MDRNAANGSCGLGAIGTIRMGNPSTKISEHAMIATSGITMIPQNSQNLFRYNVNVRSSSSERLIGFNSAACTPTFSICEPFAPP